MVEITNGKFGNLIQGCLISWIEDIVTNVDNPQN